MVRGSLRNDTFLIDKRTYLKLRVSVHGVCSRKMENCFNFFFVWNALHLTAGFMTPVSVIFEIFWISVFTINRLSSQHIINWCVCLFSISILFLMCIICLFCESISYRYKLCNYELCLNLFQFLHWHFLYPNFAFCDLIFIHCYAPFCPLICRWLSTGLPRARLVPGRGRVCGRRQDAAVPPVGSRPGGAPPRGHGQYDLYLLGR